MNENEPVGHDSGATGLTFKNRADATLWAQGVLAEVSHDPQSVVILDTETTGIRNAEIVQIGLLYGDGTPALNSLVRPPYGWPIPKDATAIHGITDADVADAPRLHELLPRMADILHGKRVIVYNVRFDFEVLFGCLYRRKAFPGSAQDPTQFGNREAVDARAVDGAYTWLNKCASWECAMHAYAAFVGEPGRYGGGFKWQKLPSSGEGKAHGAMADCRSALEVIKRMANAETEAPRFPAALPRE